MSGQRSLRTINRTLKSIWPLQTPMKPKPCLKKAAFEDLKAYCEAGVTEGPGRAPTATERRILGAYEADDLDKLEKIEDPTPTQSWQPFFVGIDYAKIEKRLFAAFCVPEKVLQGEDADKGLVLVLQQAVERVAGWEWSHGIDAHYQLTPKGLCLNAHGLRAGDNGRVVSEIVYWKALYLARSPGGLLKLIEDKILYVLGRSLTKEN